MARAAARLESLGIPTMIVTRQGFSQVVKNGFAGLGFPPDGPTIHEFPNEMFDEGSDLTPINENIDKIVYGLTKWEPEIKVPGVYAPPKITVEGTDYRDTLENLNRLFLQNQWSDGLPLQPATEERVSWILSGTDLPRDTVVGAGKILPKGGIASMEYVSVALAMAGGRPEYLPLLAAAVEAMMGLNPQTFNPTTCSVMPAFVVNGPIAKQVRLNSGYGCLGPDPLHPAGASIGRALRLILQDMGGAIPGTGTMAIYGGPRRYTNYVFAEDEEGLPEGWPSLAEELGFAKGANVVSATTINSAVNILWYFGTKELNEFTLSHVAKIMTSPNINWAISHASGLGGGSTTTAGLVLFPRGFANSLAEANGYSKSDMKTFLWDRATIPWSYFIDMLEARGRPLDSYTFVDEEQDQKMTPTPEDIRVVVAGGDQSGHGYWMQPFNMALVSAEIKVPANWDALLKEAEEDLGPLPGA